MMMTKSGMEAVSPASAYFMNPNWILGEEKWSQQENKMFENALAHIDSKTPDRWEKVAAMVPGKTVIDVISHYRDLEVDVTHIEAGLIPFPGYSSSPFTLDWESGGDGMMNYCSVGAKRSGGRLSDQERKKGVPWTEEEHKLFLMGLNKYGKGDWRNISHNFVVSRTPTQVASHAQKYFIRLNSGGKDKRRASIHDITTVNLPPDNAPSPPSQPSALTMQSTSAVASGRSYLTMVVDSSDQQHSEAASGFSSPLIHGNQFMQQLPYAGVDPYGIKLEAQNSHSRGSLHDSSMVARRAMLI